MAVPGRRGVVLAIVVSFLVAQVVAPCVMVEATQRERLIVRLNADAYAAARRAGISPFVEQKCWFARPGDLW